MFEKDTEEYRKNFNYYQDWHGQIIDKSPSTIVEQSFQDGAEFGYNKAKEEMQAQEYSMSYENGIFKCKYKSGKKFESIDGETWKEIVLPKESE